MIIAATTATIRSAPNAPIFSGIAVRTFNRSVVVTSTRAFTREEAMGRPARIPRPDLGRAGDSQSGRTAPQRTRDPRIPVYFPRAPRFGEDRSAVLVMNMKARNEYTSGGKNRFRPSFIVRGDWPHERGASRQASFRRGAAAPPRFLQPLQAAAVPIPRAVARSLPSQGRPARYSAVTPAIFSALTDRG